MRNHIEKLMRGYTYKDFWIHEEAQSKEGHLALAAHFLTSAGGWNGDNYRDTIENLGSALAHILAALEADEAPAPEHHSGSIDLSGAGNE